MKKSVKKKSVKKAVKKPIKKAKAEKTVQSEPIELKKITKLKVFLLDKNINQNKLSENTSLSTNTVNRLVNNGTASKSVIKLISYELGLTVDELTRLLGFIDTKSLLKKKAKKKKKPVKKSSNEKRKRVGKLS